MSSAARTTYRKEPVSSLLVDGDQLDADEFLRRYQANPDLEHVELIEGVVHMPSPTRAAKHGRPQHGLITCFGYYEAYTPGVLGSAPSSVLLDWRNVPEPDAFLWIDASSGGQAWVNEQDYLEGSPDLIAEISASSKGRDLGPKYRAYERNGVREYIVVLVKEQELKWHVLREGKYELLKPTPAGVYKSEVFPGLWLDAPAVLRTDLAQAFQVLDRGLATRAHANFVRRLKQATRRSI